MSFARVLLHNLYRKQFIKIVNIENCACFYSVINKQPAIDMITLSFVPCRYKSKAKKPKATFDTGTETEDQEDDFDGVADKHSKLLSANLSSLRLDSILKAGLGIARNKVETLFYESKIRLNEKKVLKKSVVVQEGDEIDVIKEVNPKNPDLMTVARVEVLGINMKSNSYVVKLRRTKSLLVDYDKNDENANT